MDQPAVSTPPPSQLTPSTNSRSSSALASTTATTWCREPAHFSAALHTGSVRRLAVMAGIASSVSVSVTAPSIAARQKTPIASSHWGAAPAPGIMVAPPAATATSAIASSPPPPPVTASTATPCADAVAVAEMMIGTENVLSLSILLHT